MEAFRQPLLLVYAFLLVLGWGVRAARRGVLRFGQLLCRHRVAAAGFAARCLDVEYDIQLPLKQDRLLAFDTSALPVAPTLLAETSLPAADMHGMELWITGPQGAGSAKGIVVTNATGGAAGSGSLIDAASHTITATIPVGKNPKQVTVYYYGLAASDNQATPVN